MLASGWGSFSKSKSHSSLGTMQAWFPTGELIYGHGSCPPTSLPTGFFESGLSHISHTWNGSPHTLTLVRLPMVRSFKYRAQIYFSPWLLLFQNEFIIYVWIMLLSFWHAGFTFLCHHVVESSSIAFMLIRSHSSYKQIFLIFSLVSSCLFHI